MSYASLIQQGEADILNTLGVPAEFYLLMVRKATANVILTQCEGSLVISLGGADYTNTSKMVVSKSAFIGQDYAPEVGHTVIHGGTKYTIIKIGSDALENVWHCDLSR